MKRYQEFMDGVTVSDTLHEKLKHLEAPKKKTQPWKKYGAVAAALVLVLGIGAAGLGTGRNVEPGEIDQELSAPTTETSEPAIEPAPAPMPNSPGMEMMGGYELRQGEGPNSTVEYYCLPYIRYSEIEAPMEADIALPVGVTRRDLTPEEIEALFGGEHNLTAHLNWNDYTIYAHAMLNRDSSLWMLWVSGSKGDTGLEHFSLEVMPGELPPSCLYYERSQLNNIWERDVWAESYDSLQGSSRRVSFMDRGYGYRFEITGFKAGDITELVSRLVRWIIVGDGLTFEKEEPAVNSEEMTTMPYDPSADPTPTAEPN